MQVGASKDPGDGNDIVRAGGGNDRVFGQGGDDELHLSAGLGVAFDKVQIDVGLDISELRDTMAVSMIYSF